MKIWLNKDNELSIARFIKGLSPNIANKTKLRPYLSFHDVFHLTIKTDKQPKVKNPFQPHHLVTTKVPPRAFRHNTVDTTTTPTKALDKDKGIAGELNKRLEENQCFKCYGYGYFRVDCPN